MSSISKDVQEREVLQYIALAYTYNYYVGEGQDASVRPQPYL